MGLVETIKVQLLEARKAKNELAKGVLSVVLGDIQTLEGSKSQKGDVTEGQAEKIVQKMINSNEETMSEIRKMLAKEPRPLFDPEVAAKFGKLESENEILAKLLPKACSREEMKNHLIPLVEQLKAAKSDGQATGVAMKLLAGLEGSKDGKIVGEIVKELRNAVE